MCPPTSPPPLPQKFLYMSQGLSFLSPGCEISPKLVEIFLPLKRINKIGFLGCFLSRQLLIFFFKMGFHMVLLQFTIFQLLKKHFLAWVFLQFQIFELFKKLSSDGFV
jgi:hypothetical protein